MTTEEIESMWSEAVELAKNRGSLPARYHFAELVEKRCIKIIYGQAESDNVAQRTVDAIRGKA